jgi:hypothetical protein
MQICPPGTAVLANLEDICINLVFAYYFLDLYAGRWMAFWMYLVV